MRAKPKPLTSNDPLKRKILNRDGRKKTRKKKEQLRTEIHENCGGKPYPQPGEKDYVYLDDASGSEYMPSESDGYSSEGLFFNQSYYNLHYLESLAEHLLTFNFSHMYYVTEILHNS